MTWLKIQFLNFIFIDLEEDVRSHFKKYGSILDIRHFKAQGYSFVRFDTKEAAAKAIADLNGSELNGQAIRCSWGKTEVRIFYILIVI